MQNASPMWGSKTQEIRPGHRGDIGLKHALLRSPKVVLSHEYILQSWRWRNKSRWHSWESLVQSLVLDRRRRLRSTRQRWLSQETGREGVALFYTAECREPLRKVPTRLLSQFFSSCLPTLLCSAHWALAGAHCLEAWERTACPSVCLLSLLASHSCKPAVFTALQAQPNMRKDQLSTSQILPRDCFYTFALAWSCHFSTEGKRFHHT